MSEAEVGQGGAEGVQSEAEVVQSASALDALRAGDLDAFSDWLHAAHFATPAAASTTLRSLAASIVAEGLAAGFAPTATVDEITATLVGRCGISVTSADADNGAEHSGAQSRRSVVETGSLDELSARRELLAAYDEIAHLRAERDALETRIDELSGARVLADQLAAELERDEWIRARLRRLKATRPVRGLIYVRRKVRSRMSSVARR